MIVGLKLPSSQSFLRLIFKNLGFINLIASLLLITFKKWCVQYITSQINIQIEQKQLMMETKLDPISLSKTSLINRYNIQSNSLLQYLEYNHKHSPDRQYIYTPPMKEEEYEQQWQHQFLRQLQEELNSDQPVLPYFDNRDLIEYRGDRLSRQINLGTIQKAVNKSKKKEFQKFKAYAVKLKIPSFHQVNRPATKEGKTNNIVKDKNTASSAYIKQIQELINPKLPNSLKESLKQYVRARNYEPINDRKIFKRFVKSSQNQKNLNIRKRSIKHVEKKESQQIRNDFQNNDQCQPSKGGIHKGLKKQNKVSQRQTVAPCFESKLSECKQRDKSQGRNHQIHMRQLATHDKRFRSPKMLIEKQEEAKIDYLQKGINFKRKQKESLKQGQNINEKKITSLVNKKIKKQGSVQLMNQSGSKQVQPVVRETPRNFLLQSLMFPKDVKMRRTQNMDELKHVSKQQKCMKQAKITKIISFNSQDRYIRRILQGLGWVVNPDSRSKYYHLKWVFKPAAEDYNVIREGQYINHIKNSHQLTSKHCLNKNLKAYYPQWTNLYDYYPQCYDISKPAQKQQFFEQYTKQFMMLLLRKIYTFLQTVQYSHIQQLKLKYQKLLASDGLYSTDEKLMSFMRKKQFRNIEMENYKSFRSDFTLHINLLIAALKYWRFLRKQEEFEADDGYHFLNYNQKDFQHNMGYLERYSQMPKPTYITDSLQYFSKEFYSTPSSIVIERIVKEYVYFQRKYNKRWSVFGQGNIWIVKPCSASRGNGIYLQNNCKQILFNSKGIQARIVQKYIERPLLFRNPSFPKICNRKFDIRQWVLLRSVDPLEIHMFSHCYVRICSQDYNIDNINNLKSHLTNYSFNKQQFKNPEESVLDYKTFKSLLMSEYKVDYEKQIKEKIKKIIIKSIKSAQELLNDYGKRCFSLLGYDILLDQNTNPWLLEINMSPACQQRTQWLKNYLKEMGKGMLQIVLPKQYLQNQNEAEPLQNGSVKYKKKRIETKPNEVIEMKRIKTEVSHELLAPLYENKYNINSPQSKPNQAVQDDKHQQMEQLKQSESVLDEQEQQITYEDFIKENFITEEQRGYYSDDQEAQKTDQLKKNKRNQGQDAVQHTELQDFRTQESKNLPILSQIQVAVQQTKLQTQAQQIEAQSEEYQEVDDHKDENQLRWELICFQQYYVRRKEIDGLIQISGMKMANEIVRSNDIKIDQFEETRNEVLNSIITVQSKIKDFLKRRQILRKKNEQIKCEQRIKFEQKIKCEQQIKYEQKLVNPIKQEETSQKIQIQKEQQKLESPIKSEISLQQKHKELKQSLKLNFSCIHSKTRSQRKPRSRSVLDSDIESIWHYSYVHTYREGVVEKVEVVRNETVLAKKSPKHKKMKNFYENHPKDRTSSAAVNAVADLSVSYLQQLLQKRNKRQQKQEEVQKQLKMELSIAQDQKSQQENEIKEPQSQNLID